MHRPNMTEDEESASQEEHQERKDLPHSTVSFGRVNVHRHRMTLGSNPFTTRGTIPVELSWDAESSDEMSMEHYESSDVDDSSKPPKRRPRKLSPDARRTIAEEHHTRESIFAVLKEASLIRHAIVKSLEDEDDENAESDASLYMDASADTPPALSPSRPPPSRETSKHKIEWSKRLCERMQKDLDAHDEHDASLRNKSLSNKPKLKWSKRLCNRLQHRDSNRKCSVH